MILICDIQTRKEKKLKYPYEFNHKFINGIEYKMCSSCNDWHPLNEDWFYKNKSSPDGFNPYCKVYTIKKSRQWELDHPEEYKENNRRKIERHRFNPDKIERNRRAANKNRIEGYQKQWRKENKDKISRYNLNRKMHKEHDITDNEWFACLDYFNNSCAYCYLSEREQYKLYNEQFHKEHVIHNGSNYIDNCVQEGTSCNTSKNDKEFNDWYNESNEVFSKRRLNKIINWMTKECFKVLNIR